MTDLLFWAAALTCVIAQGAIVRFALRAHQRADGAPVDIPAPRRPIEIGWTVLPAVALALVLVATWHAMHPRPAAPTVPALEQSR